MKAFLLAAGLATRLKPITNEIPKCLIEIFNQPLLYWWIKLFEKHKIDEVLINLHHLPKKITEYLNLYNGPIKFHQVYEENLLGSGGTLIKNKNFVQKESCFIIAYADNLTNYNLSQFINFHTSHEFHFSMALFETDVPEQKGIAILDNADTIVDFIEKPVNPKSYLANAGIYVCDPEVLDLIPDKEFSDLGFDLLPKLVNRMKGWKTNDFLMDIGTIEHLKRAQKIWPNKLKGNNYELI